MRDAPEALLLVAGQGDYPLLAAEGARAAGVRRLAVLALRGQTSRRLARLADEVRWFGVGQVEAGLAWAQATGVRQAMLVGQVTPRALFHGRFDALARSLLRRLTVKNAHAIFGQVAALLAERGIAVLPASCYMERFLPEFGVLSSRPPDAREQADIAHGHRVALALGEFDVGQTVVVREGMVLAVESFEGTNRAIARGGRLGGRGAVVVKAARGGHDMRFDIPVVGRTTMAFLRRFGASALAFQARRTILLDREAVLAAADRHGLSVVALDSGLPPAPTRPPEAAA
jgi:DUF1009 family protein